MSARRVAICGAVYPDIDGDCLCLTEPHSEDGGAPLYRPWVWT